jgi:predicted AlkP superfamily phosphohydrolase/phosphomutase
MSHRVSRRRFLQSSIAAATVAGCGRGPKTARSNGELDRMIVLGVDGMDPKLLARFIDEGRMPNCKRLRELGSFQSLQTSNPPQSPVAWSNFISGTNPGGHGIFDFIARDPETMQPFHSISRLEGGSKPIKVGRWAIPTAPATLKSRRHGPTFWNDLERHGVDCSIFRVPANFPPTEGEARTLAGMGTPDLQGGYGTFSFYTDDPAAKPREVSGGRIEAVTVRDHAITCTLRGPVNEFAAPDEKTGESEVATVPIVFHRDPERRTVRVTVQEKTFILQEGEWSDWIPVRFTLLPWAAEASGICRMYLKSVHSPFAVYVSPVNVDPANPSIPLTTPANESKRLVRQLGYFSTQGMVEDTHALSSGVLDSNEYRQQAMFVHDERMRFYEHELSEFRQGFLFYYFSTLDLSSHMFWRAVDPKHPLYTPELAASQGDFIASLYQKVDQAIGRAMERLDDRTWLIVMSDHGFASFRRQFNLNSWLLDNGYLRTRGAPARAGSTLFQGVDWGRSRAYGLGLNGLYLNQAGREAEGTVRAEQVDRLAEELTARLQKVQDSETGVPVIKRVFRASQIYSGPHASDGPDLIVGYHENYRASWDTILGGFPRQHVLDNTDAWSGDHCIDPSLVSGVLLSSRPLRQPTPQLENVAPTILRAFGAPIPAEMTGTPLS